MRDLYFIHITDSHIGPDEHYALHGVNTYATNQRVLSRIREICDSGVPVDCVVHTGDITADGDDISANDDSTKLAKRMLSDLPVPLYVINGNHDDLASVGPAFAHTNSEALTTETPSLSCIYRIKDDGLIFLDARPDLADPEHSAASTGDIRDPAGYLPKAQLDALEAELRSGRSKRVSLFLHYPPIPLDSAWMDRRMLVTNGGNFHDLIRPYADIISGVYFGHIHQGLQITLDGILYSAANSLSCQFSGWPDDQKMAIAIDPIGHFQYVALRGGSTVIKQQTVMIRHP